MATLAQLRAALAARLDTITSFKGGYVEAPGQVDPPAYIIRLGSPAITYATAVTPDAHDYQFSILVLVATAQGAPAQELLDAYLDPTGTDSVYAVIAASPTLGGAAAAALVTTVTNAGLVSWAGADYLGAEFLVEVLA